MPCVALRLLLVDLWLEGWVFKNAWKTWWRVEGELRKTRGRVEEDIGRELRES